MNRIVKEAVKARNEEKFQKKNPVVNFMGGISYEVNPLDTLKMITASSIFAEPSYYRNGGKYGRVKDGTYNIAAEVSPYSVLDPGTYNGKTTTQIMEEAIDSALDFDFGATLDWAVALRTQFNMRLNPQVIMVRAAMNPNRVKFNEENPGKFAQANSVVMSRADEPASQLAYYLFANGSKKSLPNPLKKDWKRKLESLSPYQVAKYKNTGLGMIDVARICHANSPVLDELMQTGTVEVDEDKKTWENLRSEGKSWAEILDTIKLGHMALLRNLRNIFTEISDPEVCRKLMQELKDGVLTGKQFPFRYYSAWNAVRSYSGDKTLYNAPMILDTLEECIDISLANLPRLKGKTMCLSDNSGSAWGVIPTEYGSVTVAEIDNLSSVIAAMGSDEGYVGKFGDELIVTPISKRNGALSQAAALSANRCRDIGGATENGIWLFFEKAIENREHWDNIMIFSDQQAGHGGLYGTYECERKYGADYGVDGGSFIDVAKLVETYRREVNPKVNVFSIQTAGYNNVLLPEYTYRGNFLYGWTGKELVFADQMIRFWDEQDAKHRA